MASISGIAHGNQIAAVMLLERQRAAPDRTEHYFTSSTIVVAWMYRIAVDYLEALLRIYAESARPRRGQQG